MAEAWTDLLDPADDEIRSALPATVEPAVWDQLVRPPGAAAARPTVLGYRDYVFGVLVVAVAVREQDRIVFHEVDFVATRERLLTVRKTPRGGAPLDTAPVHRTSEVRGEDEPGRIVYHLVDEVAERYIDLLDSIDDEIDELEEHVDEWPDEQVYRRLSALRHDLLHVRRTLAPTRDALRELAEGRVDVHGRSFLTREVFPPDVEREIAGVLNKLLRAHESLEFSRDLLAAVRDYHQATLANVQNETVKRLTAIASVLLFPTFVVGVYGQNFEDMPELGWRFGYAFSWAVIVVATIGQLVFYRRKRWI